MVDYKLLFSKFEESIKRNIFISETEFDERLKPYLGMDFRKMSDKDIFWVLVYVNFFSGIKAVTVEKKLSGIKSELYDYKKLYDLDENTKKIIIQKIGFPNKCNYSYENARLFKKLLEEYGSFINYVASFGIQTLNPDISNINNLKEDLKKRFYGLGPRTVNHFLTDLGFNVLKPDRVICRIFYRLGLIDSVDNIEGAIQEGKKFEESTEKPIRYIDIIFVKFGQMGKSEQFGTKDGICLEKNPNCKICSAKELCKYYKGKMQSASLQF